MPSFSPWIVRLFTVPLLGTVLIPGTVVAQDASPPSDFTQASQRLGAMFSPAIRETINACATEGGVKLTDGADRDGSVICNNGSRSSAVNFNTYTATLTDFWAASLLMGLRAAVKADKDATPEKMADFVDFLASDTGKAFLRDATAEILTQGAIPDIPKAASSQAVVLLGQLMDNIVDRSLLLLQRPNGLEALLGTPQQYAQVVEKFCTAPGMTIAEAQKLVPTFSSVQFYAVCIQDSGLVDALVQESPSPSNPGSGSTNPPPPLPSNAS